jgi:hypothetical protein
MYSYKAFGLSISSEIELPELSRSDSVKLPDVAIRIGHFSLPKLKGVPIQRRGIQAEFGVDSNESLVLHWDDVADFMAVDGNLLIVSPLTGDGNLLSLFTVSEALGLILFQRGYFLLHASSVKVGDEAWCFMGNPGAGKSTTAAAFIKAGCELLSDDLTAIDFDANGVARIIPAYPQLKIWDNTVTGLQYDKNSLQPVSEGVNKYSFQPVNGFDHDPVRLGAVYFIHKAKNQAVKRALTPAEIPIQTIKNFPLPIELLKGDNLKRHFAQSFRCAAGASLWKMRRPDGFANLEKWVQASLSLFPSRQ